MTRMTEVFVVFLDMTGQLIYHRGYYTGSLANLGAETVRGTPYFKVTMSVVAVNASQYSIN